MDDFVLTEQNNRDLDRLKQYFPFRHIWYAIVDGEFQAQATVDKRRMNKLARAGHKVFLLKFGDK